MVLDLGSLKNEGIDLEYLLEKGIDLEKLDKTGIILAMQSLLQKSEILNKAYSFSLENLYQKSNEDLKTGLLNKQSLLGVLKSEINKQKRSLYDNGDIYEIPEDKKGLAYIMLDIDYFKRVNDTFGHLVGDKVIEAVANQASKHARRESDKVARYGGEEIAIVLPNISYYGALKVANDIRLGVENEVKIGEDIPRYGITASLGIDFYLNGDITVDEIIAEADSQLYKAKHNGRNAVFFKGNNITPTFISNIETRLNQNLTLSLVK